MDELEMSARYISLHRRFLFGEPMTLPEIEEHAVLEDWMNERCGITSERVTRTIPAEQVERVAADSLPTRETLHRDERGRWVTADGRLVDLAAVSRRSMAQMTTHEKPDPKGAPGSALQYSQSHYTAHIH